MTSRRRPLVPCLLLALVLAWSPAAHAFCPTNGLRCGASGVGVTHQDMTEEALEELGQEFFGLAPTPGMKGAAEQVWKANAEVDADQVNGFLHFDGESFVAGKQRLVALFDGIPRSLRAGDAEGGRRQLGQALHSVQDFYAHSNWIESGQAGALPSLWRSAEPLPALAGEQTPTCAPCEFSIGLDGNLLVNCDRNVSTSALTSGYYGGENEVPAHDAKCRHGGPTDTGPGPFGGINKDTWMQALSPHHALHGEAAVSALEASKQFIRDLKAQLTESQLKLLFGVGPTLTVAVDTSAGMGPWLLQAARQLGPLLESRLGTGEAPTRYVLVPFQGQAPGATRVADAPRALQEVFSTPGTRASGTCSAPSLAAVLQALEASSDAGELFLLTQSRASDEGLLAAVSGLARRKHIRVHALLTDTCGAAASTQAVYRRLAEETGGQVFSLRLSDVGVLTRLVDATVRARPVTLLSVVDAAGGSRTLNVPVDRSISQVTFSLSGANTLRLVRPNGVSVTPRDPDVRVAQGASGAVVTVLAPAAGTWRVGFASAGAFSFQVRGESPLDVERFDFVEALGRPGHQGYLPSLALPGPVPRLAAAQLSGDVASARFELRTPGGTPLLPLALAPEAGGSSREFFGLVPLSTQSFVLQAEGRTATGETWQRVVPGVVRPRTVALRAPGTQRLAPGERVSVRVRVENLGASDVFRPSVLSARRLGARVTPEVLSLGQGQEGFFTVEWEVPRDATPGTSITVSTLLEGRGAPGTENVVDVVGIVSRP
ncbi:hypothetical protein [Archangium primigenium]|uniref:hypothetical protein n=1 Tax=[Archangium] primigenium TaxID=2792470 RepID=UPI001957CD62|nr:hypothetical protein [Archangium primigenium]MBM7118853.1 hypothetical protein [Archangium primigenium]